MLMKLTASVNLINVLRANFLYEFLPKAKNITREKLPKQHLYEKIVHEMLVKLSPGLLRIALAELERI